MMGIKFLMVALGGAIGASLRYSISLLPYKGTFPVLTLVTNLLGAFLIGLICGIASEKGMPDNAQLLLKTGLCGGFTTFSTFSLEAYNLFKAEHAGLAVIYIALSVTLCLLGVAGGMLVAGGRK